MALISFPYICTATVKFFLVILDLAGGNPRCIETYDYDDEDGLLARKGFYHYIYRGDCLFFKRTKHH